jgi:hypothetical protein
MASLANIVGENGSKGLRSLEIWGLTFSANACSLLLGFITDYLERELLGGGRAEKLKNG